MESSNSMLCAVFNSAKQKITDVDVIEKGITHLKVRERTFQYRIKDNRTFFDPTGFHELSSYPVKDVSETQVLLDEQIHSCVHQGGVAGFFAESSQEQREFCDKAKLCGVTACSIPSAN